MSRRWLAALAAFALVFAAQAGDKKKLDYAPETGPRPRQVPACPGMTLPSPHYLEGHPPQYFPADPCCRPARAPKAAERSVMKTYHVGDLVITPPPAGKVPTDRPTTQERALIQNIQSKVSPDCWQVKGGDCTVEYYPLGLALVVSAPPTIHEALEKYLDDLRQIQDTQFQVKLVVATVSATGLEKMGLARDFGPTRPGEVRSRIKFLSADELPAFDRFKTECVTMSAPTITVLNAQEGCVQIGEVEHFLTGVDVRTHNGGLVFTPKNEPQHIGVEARVRPILSNDRKFVKLAVSAHARDVTLRPAALVPLTTKIKPVFENGAPGAEVPFTQFLQDPRIVTRSVDETVTLPDGGTVAFYGGPATIEETVLRRPPMFDIPFLQDLFAHDTKVSRTNHLVVFAAVKVVKDAGCDECIQCAGGNGRLVKLMAEYGRACREGNAAEARRLALECLVIDPTCFARK
jgi:hypothetical protein